MAKRSDAHPDEPPADSFERLVRELEKLPGVGRRSAERMAYYVLGASKDEAMALAIAIRDVKKNLHPCVECGDLTEAERCAICKDTRRDTRTLCVVEWPREVRALEKAGEYRGRYHVLMGRLSPLSGISPEDLRIAPLLERVARDEVEETVLATSPTVEGDATAAYLREELKRRRPAMRVTRIARGLPAGSDLSFAQASTLGDALKGRTEIR